ncbi:MAG: 3-deoxy-D-manno-octulosonic acid transferase [bacterium]
MLIFGYNLLLCGIIFLCSPVILILFIFKKRIRKRFHKRFHTNPGSAKTGSIWVHCASVGEVRTAAAFIHFMREESPHHSFLITTMTMSGMEMAKTLFPDIPARLFPLDLPWIVKSFLRKLRPSAILIAETEIWPNLYYYAAFYTIPIVVFNGRLSDNSYRRYRQFKWLFKGFLKKAHLFLMQDTENASRLHHLGVKKTRILITGNLKYEIKIPDLLSISWLTHLKKQLVGRKILVAGSTHEGEEKILVTIFKKLKGHWPSLIMILAPRHAQRFHSVEKLLQSHRVHYLRKSTLKENQDLMKVDIILLDTLGELLCVYSIADIVFIGGSLVPIGGHTPLEAVAFSKPVIYGPHMENFREIASYLKKEKAALQVNNGKELAETIDKLLYDRILAHHTGEIGHRILIANRGTAERIWMHVKKSLEMKQNAYRCYSL